MNPLDEYRQRLAAVREGRDLLRIGDTRAFAPARIDPGLECPGRCIQFPGEAPHILLNPLIEGMDDDRMIGVYGHELRHMDQYTTMKDPFFPLGFHPAVVFDALLMMKLVTETDAYMHQLLLLYALAREGDTAPLEKIYDDAHPLARKAHMVSAEAIYETSNDMERSGLLNRLFWEMAPHVQTQYFYSIFGVMEVIPELPAKTDPSRLRAQILYSEDQEALFSRLTPFCKSDLNVTARRIDYLAAENRKTFITRLKEGLSSSKKNAIEEFRAEYLEMFWRSAGVDVRETASPRPGPSATGAFRPA